MSSFIEHLLSKTVEGLQINGKFSLAKRRPTLVDKPVEIILSKLNRSIVLYNEFEHANLLFNEYLTEIKKNTDPVKLQSKLHKMELMGAKVYINEVECIVLEERKNCVVVVYRNNNLKLHMKNRLIFYMLIDGIKYFFNCQNLKLNRFQKK